MSNLNKHLGKYFTGKIIDVIFILIFLAALYYTVIWLSAIHPWLGLLGLVVILVIVWYTGKEKDKLMDKWTVPELDIKEKKDMLLFDTGLFVLVTAFVIKITWNYLNKYFLVGILGVMLVIRTVKGWRKFYKERKLIDDNNGESESPKEEDNDQLIVPNSEEEAKKIITESFIDMAKEDTGKEEKHIEENIKETQDAEIERMKKEAEPIASIGPAKTTDNPDIKEGDKE